MRRTLTLLLLAAAPLAAQAQKKALTQADWDRWQSIQGATLSNDGKWLAYTLAPQVGDGEFVVRSTSGTTEYRVPLGYISRPNNTPGGERGRGGAPGGGGGGGGRGGAGGGGAGGPFTADSKFAFVTTQPTKAEVEAQQRAAAAGRGGRGGRGGAAAAPANQNRVVMISLADGKTTPLPDVRTYRLAPNGGKWMIFTSAPDSAAAGDSSGRGGGAQAAGGGAGGRGGRGGQGGAPAAGGGGNRRTYGSAITLRNLDTNADEKLADVLAYQFDDSAKVLVYTVASRSDSTKDGVYIRDLTAGTTKTVMSGPGNYRAFTFDQNQQQFTFTSDRDEFGREKARSVAYLGNIKSGTAQAVIKSDILPPNMRFPDNFSVGFTRNGNALTFSVAPPPEDTIPADSLIGKARFDLWHWQDPQLQPQQLLQVNQARNRTYQAIYSLQSKRVVQLTTDSFPSIQLSDDAKIGLANTGMPYNVERMWGEGGSDVYLVDPSNGTRKLIRKKLTGNAQLSVSAKFVTFFEADEWYSYNIATGKEVCLTCAYPNVHWEQETHSTPNEPPSWGIAGWTKDDRSMLVNDRFDIWELDPTGVRAPIMLTDSLGRREHITLRMIGLDRDDDERYLDTSKPVWLSAFDEDNKQSGFYRTTLNARKAPEKVVMADVRYGNPSKARDANVYMVTKSTFVEFPNVYVGPNLTTLTRITNANAFQSEYNWGTSELVEWFSSDGVPRQGILYKPENFDPKKKYPMISYFYEDLSDGLYSYIAPNGRNTINPTHYVSNGYLVFEPDIYYEMGHPGPSAMKSIVPGVQKLLERGYVDPKGLGLQGQSWGGYQTSYLITQTSMFSAAMAGAPVANMFSAYGGIRWGSGLNRSMQYENGQSRIGKSIWEAQQLYIENSPLFWLDRVTTPLFIMHNDQDDAVPWYQGIEMFVGLRRLGKEVYMINYNNDVHNPASRANQKDIAMRMQQFFDNKLKGSPAPDWMVNGIAAKDKGKDQVVTPVIRQ
ncbi:MAG TPA: prolyl oligopeptidase family serine peptidase [Gemmatimonadaceae bacterium]|nr:prolyl oligopeptidase family serine peptidase [Gemmatimonadaceae bacterium]